MSYDPLQFEYHSTPDAWACYYDPEGPVGYGKTREKALEELYELCDHPHGEAMLWGSIVAAIDKPKPMPGEFIPPMHDRSKADMGDINSPLREGDVCNRWPCVDSPIRHGKCHNGHEQNLQCTDNPKGEQR